MSTKDGMSSREIAACEADQAEAESLANCCARSPMTNTLRTARIELMGSYCSFKRLPGDLRIAHESTVGYRLKKLLNNHGFNFVRMNPSKHGLTACTLGMIDHKRGIILWHERYAIENAAKAYNAGEVTFMRTEVEQ